MSQSRKLLVPQSTATNAASLISTPFRYHPCLATSYHADLPASYARFVIDLRKRNQHDPKPCGATPLRRRGFASERTSAGMRHNNKTKDFGGRRRDQSSL
jgi:hypothetical protein